MQLPHHQQCNLRSWSIHAQTCNSQYILGGEPDVTSIIMHRRCDRHLNHEEVYCLGPRRLNLPSKLRPRTVSGNQRQRRVDVISGFKDDPLSRIDGSRRHHTHLATSVAEPEVDSLVASFFCNSLDCHPCEIHSPAFSVLFCTPICRFRQAPPRTARKSGH